MPQSTEERLTALEKEVVELKQKLIERLAFEELRTDVKDRCSRRQPGRAVSKTGNRPARTTSKRAEATGRSTYAPIRSEPNSCDPDRQNQDERLSSPGYQA